MWDDDTARRVAVGSRTREGETKMKWNYPVTPAAVFALALTVWVTPTTVLAQATGAEILGTVADAGGGVLPGVSVTVTNVGTGLTRNLVTDGEGRYRAPNLPVGNYEVQAELSGFRMAIRQGIQLTVGRAAIVDLTLTIGTVTESVTVTGEAPLVDVTTSSLGGLVDREQIENLPLNGRNFVQLTLLETGVTHARTASQSQTFGSGLKMSVNGARMDYNNFMMDGTSMNSVNQIAIGGTSGQALGSEAIQEFQVLTSNFTAEFGRSGGAVINVVTKSGTNRFAGSTFYYNRNEAMDSPDFFDTRGLPPFSRNQFGATFGGPIQQDRMFFFAAYEGLRETLGRTLRGTVPTLAAREGILPTGTIAVDPRVQPYLALYPAPNGRDLGDGRADFVRTDEDKTSQNFVQGRVDFNLSNTDTVFVRYTRDYSDKFRPTPLGDVLFTDNVESSFASAEHTRILSPRLLNRLRGGYNRSYVDYSQEYLNPAFLDRSLWFVPNPYARGFVLGASGLSGIGGAGNLPRWRAETSFLVNNTVTFTPGRHSIKVGGEFQEIHTDEEDTTGARQSFAFRNLESMLRARGREFEVVTDESDFLKNWRQRLGAVFFQDDVQIHDDLTLNLGFRWEYLTEPSEKNGKAANVRNPLIDTPADVVVGNPLLDFPMDNFAPRVGFAWAPGGSSKMSLRGGYGTFYPLLFRIYWFTTRSNPPFVRELTAEAPTITFPHPLEGQTRTTVSGAGFDYNVKQPRINQFNLTFQREVLPSTVVSIGYVGSRGANAPFDNDVNIAIPEILPDGRKFFPAGSPRQNPAWTAFFWKQTLASSEYNALQLRLRRRLQDGLQFGASYTWSHSLDDQSEHGRGGLGNGSPPQDPTRHDLDHASSGFDVRHSATINGSYALPGPAPESVAGKVLGGWQVAGIVTLSSGFPFSARNSFDRDRDNNRRTSRPNLKAGASNNPILGGTDQYFDPTAFELQPAGFYGNLGRNTLRAPGYASVDFALTKNTTLGGSTNLEVRLEVFNLFNRANFGLPQATVFRSANGVHAADAGRITNVSGTARQGQVGLRLSF